MKKINWIQVVTCLAAGMIGTLIVILASKLPIWAGLAGISGGDWLQASAAVVGVALTVWATLWLESLNRKRSRKAEQRLVREALTILEGILPSASAPVNADFDLPKRILMTQAHYEMVRTGLESLAYARQSYRVRSYNLWSALSSIDIVHAFARERITREEGIVRGEHVTEPVLAIAREKIEGFAQELIGPVQTAVAALDDERD